jgi:hypothetical protein
VTRLVAENHRNLREEQKIFASPHCLAVGPALSPIQRDPEALSPGADQTSI